MNTILSIPSKTFIVGEYLALKGGPALLALTHPSFSLDIQKKLHPECTAARFWLEKTQNICQWGLHDPYHGKGGLGASSAEFLLAYYQLYGNFSNLEHLHKTYIDFSEKKLAQKPSGYDILAQTSWGCSVVESAPIKVTAFSWFFSDLAFIMIHTGQKLKTHEYLQKNLDISNWKDLASAVEQSIQGLEFQDADQFLQGINLFTRCLLNEGLVAQHTQDILEKLPKKSILAAKGCGALGADIIFLIVEKSQKQFLLEKLKLESFDILATETDLCLENAKK